MIRDQLADHCLTSTEGFVFFFFFGNGSVLSMYLIISLALIIFIQSKGFPMTALACLKIVCDR